MAKERTKFVELANRRVPAAVKAIELVANLSNTYNYTYTPEDAAVIVRTLKEAVAECQSRFSGKEEKISGFRLED